MPVELSMMKEEDIPAFARIDEAAMSGWAYADAMFKPGTRREIAESFCRSGWGKNPEERWVKVTDTDTGEVIAVALWLMKLEPDKSGAASAIEQQSSQTDPSEVPSLWNLSNRMGRAFDAEYVGNVPRAVLAILVSDPRHHRRGAGSMLVAWGCRQADERGIICVLTASEKGLPIYLKQGFEIKQIKELDLKPYGYDSVELRRYMIRQPQSLST